MNNDREIDLIKDKNKVYDYVFLCFFLGNDFLPHFPAINIRTGGTDKMINAYRDTFGNSNENLTDGKTINWKNVRKVVQQLANLEEEYYIKEHKLRNSRQNHRMPDSTPEEKFKKFDSIPTYEREMEQYINPVKPYWQTRYYRGLFGIMSDTSNEQKRDISINYLEGLEWTMKYYTIGCPDWRWRYKYNYPPLIQDLIQYIPVFETVFVTNKPPNPVSEIVQLCYVLPRTSLNLLPEKLYYELIRRYDHWYKGNCDFVWAYCRYFWESHVEMGEIDINELERFIEQYRYFLHNN
jgi:5'-3' exonuclease